MILIKMFTQRQQLHKNKMSCFSNYISEFIFRQDYRENGKIITKNTPMIIELTWNL